MAVDRRLLHLVHQHINLACQLSLVLFCVALFLIFSFQREYPHTQLVDVDVLVSQFFVQLGFVLEVVRYYLVQMLVSVVFTFNKRGGNLFRYFKPVLGVRCCCLLEFICSYKNIVGVAIFWMFI